MVSETSQSLKMIFVDIKRILGKLRYKIISLEKFYIVERSLPFDPDERLSRNDEGVSANCVVKRLTLSSENLFKQYMEFEDEVKKENVKEWLQDGHICLLAMRNNRIIGSEWISIRYTPYPDIPKVAAIFKGAAYFFKFFVSPDFRGRGTGIILNLHAFRISEEMGFTRATCIVYDWNKPSLGLLKKLGFLKTYKLYLLKVGMFRQCFLVPHSEYKT